MIRRAVVQGGRPSVHAYVHEGEVCVGVYVYVYVCVRVCVCVHLGAIVNDVGIPILAAAHLELERARVALLGLLDDNEARIRPPRDL